MNYLIVFLEGIITFISPCLLPLLPLYISYFAAGESDTRKTLTNAAGFVFGFSLIFVLLGAFAGTIGQFLTQYTTIFNLATGAIVVIFGLNFMEVISIPFLNKTSSKSANSKDLNLFSSILFGVVFSIGWTPCVGAFLGSALLLASQSGSTLQGVLMLLAYSLGMGIPFLFSAVLIDKLKGTFEFIKRNYKTINIISGLLLVIMGILMMTGLMGKLLATLSF